MGNSLGKKNSMSSIKRCSWADSKYPLYIDYHDTEWGVPVHDDRLHFEMLTLEWAQAWLSWITVLKKRESYRKAFDDFDVQKIVQYTDTKIQELMNNSWIIRNRLKIHSVIKNARVFTNIQREFGSFDSYIWSFTWGKQIIHHIQTLQDVPAKTILSDSISKDLKKRGMSFVWSTIIYAYLQAIWIVNDHLVECFCYKNKYV